MDTLPIICRSDSWEPGLLYILPFKPAWFWDDCYCGGTRCTGHREIHPTPTNTIADPPFTPERP